MWSECVRGGKRIVQNGTGCLWNLRKDSSVYRIRSLIKPLKMFYSVNFQRLIKHSDLFFKTISVHACPLKLLFLLVFFWTKLFKLIILISPVIWLVGSDFLWLIGKISSATLKELVIMKPNYLPNDTI